MPRIRSNTSTWIGLAAGLGLCLLCLTFVAEAAPPGGGGGPPGGTIEGTVLEDVGFGFAPEGVIPFAGATVTAFTGFEEVASTTSGADGSYSLSLPAGLYSLTATFDDGETMCNGGTQLDVRVRNNKTSHRDILISCVSFP